MFLTHHLKLFNLRNVFSPVSSRGGRTDCSDTQVVAPTSHACSTCVAVPEGPELKPCEGKNRQISCFSVISLLISDHAVDMNDWRKCNIPSFY